MGTGDRVDLVDHRLGLGLGDCRMCGRRVARHSDARAAADRPRRWFQGNQQSAPFVVAVFAYALAGAAATQISGFHPAIGAVIAGLFFPAGLANKASQRALATVADVLIPAFFVSSALSVPLETLADLFRWSGLLCLGTLSIAAFGSKVAVGLAGKLAGCSAGRLPPPAQARHRAELPRHHRTRHCVGRSPSPLDRSLCVCDVGCACHRDHRGDGSALPRGQQPRARSYVTRGRWAYGACGVTRNG